MCLIDETFFKYTLCSGLVGIASVFNNKEIKKIPSLGSFLSTNFFKKPNSK